MEIQEQFIEEILKADYPDEYENIYDNSMLIQYLDKKVQAVHKDSKARRNLGTIYAIYSILYFYQDEFFERSHEYEIFEGYNFTTLSEFYRGLYGGSKLQNHSLNSRTSSEFKNDFPDSSPDLIENSGGKYKIPREYIYIQDHDTGKTACKIIEKYIELLIEKDRILTQTLIKLKDQCDLEGKRNQIIELLTQDAEARVFEILSYAILKNYYSNQTVCFGSSMDNIEKMPLKLYKTGRTNANDGGIDFVMRPVGRFFQVTEVNDYDKYLLDIDKVMHFPISFVIKTDREKESVMVDLDTHIKKHSEGMADIVKRYQEAIEEIITINELKQWVNELDEKNLDGIIEDFDFYYRLEMDMDIEEEG